MSGQVWGALWGLPLSVLPCSTWGEGSLFGFCLFLGHGGALITTTHHACLLFQCPIIVTHCHLFTDPNLPWNGIGPNWSSLTFLGPPREQCLNGSWGGSIGVGWVVACPPWAHLGNWSPAHASPVWPVWVGSCLFACSAWHGVAPFSHAHLPCLAGEFE